MKLCSVLSGSLDRRGLWGRMDTCICMTESVWCSSETIQHSWLIGYTPIQNKMLKKFKLLLYYKRRGYDWLSQTSLCQNSLFLQLYMSAWTQYTYKSPRRQILFSVLQLFISIWMGNCYTFKGQSLEKGYTVYFRLLSNICNSQQKQ